jgi:hypothetical protein
VPAEHDHLHDAAEPARQEQVRLAWLLGNSKGKKNNIPNEVSEWLKGQDKRRLVTSISRTQLNLRFENRHAPGAVEQQTVTSVKVGDRAGGVPTGHCH